MAASTTNASSPVKSSRSLWRNQLFRSFLYQVIALVLLIAAGAYLLSNTLANLEARSIRTGFAFLGREAGFRIGESLIAYNASDSYRRAYSVGVLNTLRVSALGIVLATLIGVLVGIARLSPNWLVVKLASVYVETVRNVPLLLQLFLWYTVITGVLPAVRQALSFKLLPGVYLSKSGLMFPTPASHSIHPYMVGAFGVGIILAWVYTRWAKRRQDATGHLPQRLLPCIGLLLSPVLLVWLIGGAPTAMDVPTLMRFTYKGGSSITPEFLALLTGLTMYTAAFIAETVRGGIQAVPWGQTEAAEALGLRRGTTLRLVILPQALRIIIPPSTSQYLNPQRGASAAREWFEDTAHHRGAGR
jgi:general L-amino acid transport system permease protein